MLKKDNAMKQGVEQAKAIIRHTATRMLHNLDCTPDDRIHWSPSETARTPLEIVAHAAISITGIQFMLMREPRITGEFGKDTNSKVAEEGYFSLMQYPYATIEEIDVAFREVEKNFKTREEIKELVDGIVEEFCKYLDTMTPQRFNSTLDTFFGPIPVSFAINLPTMHTEVHIGQLQYVQTIYGDMDRHAL